MLGNKKAKVETGNTQRLANPVFCIQTWRGCPKSLRPCEPKQNFEKRADISIRYAGIRSAERHFGHPRVLVVRLKTHGKGPDARVPIIHSIGKTQTARKTCQSKSHANTFNNVCDTQIHEAAAKALLYLGSTALFRQHYLFRQHCPISAALPYFGSRQQRSQQSADVEYANQQAMAGKRNDRTSEQCII